MATWEHWVSEIQSRYSRTLPLNVYEGIIKKLPPSDRANFDSHLSNLGYSLIGLARDPNGGDLATAFIVFRKIEMSFSLTKVLSKSDYEKAQISFEVPLNADDEIWEYLSNPESWTALAGSMGFALVRQKTVVDILETTVS
jgi:hypothetical protein